MATEASEPRAAARAQSTVGQLLAERLAATGVRHAFGFPGGGSNLDMIEFLEDAGVEWVLTHTETGAAFMACATAEATNAPGVVVVGNGPGLASVVNGVAHAALDRTPMVLISDRYTDLEATSTGHQILDQRALLAPLVKYGATLDAGNAPLAIDTAIEAALTAPMGPVHLEMARDVAVRTVAAGDFKPPPASPTVPAASGDTLEAIATRLRAAERPVVLVGLEANATARPTSLRALAERIGAAVLTTYKAKGSYPEADPRWAGIFTGGEIERPLLEGADTLLAVGLDPVELLAKPWRYRAPVLSVAASGAPDAYLEPRLRIRGDVGGLVDRLVGLLGDGRTCAGFGERDVLATRTAMLDALRLDPGERLPGWRVVETVMEELEPATTITVDAGAHMFPATWFAHPSGPRRFLISNGLATMGFAVPAAIGASLARRGELALAFCGDGGMAYHMSELETAVRCGARILVVVFNDSSLSLIRVKQEAMGYTRWPLDFGLTRFAAVAEGHGVRGVSVETVDDLRAAVRDARDAPDSTVIDVRMTGGEHRETLAAIRG